MRNDFGHHAKRFTRIDWDVDVAMNKLQSLESL